jgi:hypothetical protein
MNAFRWRENPRPSIFLRDPTFTPKNKAGQTMSQISSAVVTKHIARTGRSPGSIKGISQAGDSLIEQAEHDRRRAARG